MEASNDQSLHLITVTESVNEEISATGATLKVRIAGSSFFSGREAIKKAEEVASFVEALKKGGIDEANIRLDGVTTSVERGLLTKSSSAQYDLTVSCPDLESLGPILAAVASQKTAEMSHIIWQYDQLDDTKSALLEQAVKRAHEAATLITNTLQARLLEPIG